MSIDKVGTICSKRRFQRPNSLIRFTHRDKSARLFQPKLRKLGYLGAEDTAYTANIGRMFLTAMVARIPVPIRQQPRGEPRASWPGAAPQGNVQAIVLTATRSVRNMLIAQIWTCNLCAGFASFLV
jgi:hypothetical protein